MLVIEQYRVRSQRFTSERHAAGPSAVCTKPDDELVLEDFGLRCTLADLYRGTALQPRAKR